MRPFVALALLVCSVSASVFRFDDGGYGGASFIRSEPLLLGSAGSYGSTLVRSSAPIIPITSLTQDITGSKSNHVKFTTGNGISLSDNTDAVLGRGSLYEDESGRTVQSDSSLVKSGSYSYTAPDGTPISLSWVADEDGFRAEGAHLPKPVEMPAELAEAYRVALARLAEAESLGWGSEAPALAPLFVRSSEYEATPAIRVESSYAPAPVIRASSYSAPAVRFVAPAPVLVRSGY